MSFNNTEISEPENTRLVDEVKKSCDPYRLVFVGNEKILYNGVDIPVAAVKALVVPLFTSFSTYFLSKHLEAIRSIVDLLSSEIFTSFIL